MARVPAPLRLVLLILLLCAVSARLLCPPGWMPNLDQRPGFALVICTGDGLRTLDIPEHGAPGPDQGKSHDAPCVFSGTTLVPTSPSILFAGLAEHPVVAPIRVPAGLPTRGPDRKRAQAPRAPPVAV